MRAHAPFTHQAGDTAAARSEDSDADSFINLEQLQTALHHARCLRLKAHSPEQAAESVRDATTIEAHLEVRLAVGARHRTSNVLRLHQHEK